jgi:hypothetical protein
MTTRRYRALEHVRPGCDLATARSDESARRQTAKALQRTRFTPRALTPPEGTAGMGLAGTKAPQTRGM